MCQHLVNPWQPYDDFYLKICKHGLWIGVLPSLHSYFLFHKLSKNVQKPGLLHSRYLVRSPLADITAWKCFLNPAKSLSVPVVGIFSHSPLKITCSTVFSGCLSCTALLRSTDRFLIMFKSGVYEDHWKTSSCVSWVSLWFILIFFSWSLFCCGTQQASGFTFFHTMRCLPWEFADILWNPPFNYAMFPVPLTAIQPQTWMICPHT